MRRPLRPADFFAEAGLPRQVLDRDRAALGRGVPQRGVGVPDADVQAARRAIRSLRIEGVRDAIARTTP